MTFLRLAWRNVRRNPRRSAITVAAIAVGLAALIFIWGFVDGVNEQMIENSTRYLAGHIQVHLKGYHDEQTLELTLPDTMPMLARIGRQSGVVAAARRFEARAIVSGADKSRGVMVVGVDAGEEPKVTSLHRAVKLGAPLAAEDTEAILVGDRIAEALGLDVGADLVLVGQGTDGSVAAARFRVKGIFDAGNDMIDGAYVFVPLQAAQDMFAAPGGVTTLVARLDDRNRAEAAAAELADSFGSAYEVLDWQKLLPAMVQSKNFHEVVAYVILMILFVIVAVGVTNTVLMAAMERTRELGVMMALGTTAGQLIRLVLYEAAVLGLLGLALGDALGLAITGYYARAGIDMGAYTRAVETMPGLSSVIFPLLRADRVAIVSLAVLATILVAAAYPAWRTARLRPMEAIRGLASAAGTGWFAHRQMLPRRTPIFVRIAARSIARNPRRTALTLAATTFGLTAFVYLYGFAEGYLTQLTDNSTGYVTGHLQLQHREFRKEMAPQFALDEPARVLERIRAEAEVMAAAPRVQTQALISSPTQSQGILLVGVDPLAEREVTFIERTVVSGNPLRPGQEREILIGRKLAEKLNARLGEKLVVVAQAVDGGLASAAYRISGIYATESESFDGAFGFVTLPAAQALLGLGDRVSAVAVRLRDRDRLNAVASSLAAAFADKPYAVVSWRELMAEVAQMIEMIRVNFLLIVGIVFAVVAIGVMNTLLMSVMERTREFGIMMALGTPPAAVIRLVLYESALLTAAGVAMGLVAGTALTAWYGARGVDLSAYARGITAIPGLTGIIHPRVVTHEVVVPVMILFFVSLAAAFYPAWRAARLDPVSAIRHV